MKFQNRLLALCLVTNQTMIVAQTPTIPELVARSVSTGERELRMAGLTELAMLSVTELAQRAHLIVRGRVSVFNSQLTENKRELVTDYGVAPTHVIFDRPKGTARPGQSETIIIRQRGGTLVLDGVQVVMEISNVPNLNPDTDYVLMLTFNPKIDRYEIVGDGLGAFEVTAKGIRDLVKQPRKMPHVGMDVSRFVSELQSLKKAQADGQPR